MECQYVVGALATAITALSGAVVVMWKRVIAMEDRARESAERISERDRAFLDALKR